jgi:hypothetical protein
MNPNYQKKWLLLIIISVVALSLTAAIPTTGPSSPWRGAWWSIDPFDDSLQKVVFGGGSQGRFNYIDWGASVCGTDINDNPLYAAHASGVAETVDGTLFEGFAPVVCMTHPPYTWEQSRRFSWTYDPATDTLSDGLSIWTRTLP